MVNFKTNELISEIQKQEWLDKYLSNRHLAHYSVSELEKRVSMKIKYAILTIIILVFSGCGTTGRIVNPDYKLIDIPPIDAVQDAELGDTILKKAKVYSLPVIILEHEAKVGMGWSIPPQKLVLRTRSNSGDFYWGELGAYNFGRLTPGGIYISHRGDIKAFYGNTGGKGKFSIPPVLKHDMFLVPVKDSFNQELIYNGYLGTGVKFLYREFSGDTLRAPFSQEIQYDLNDSKIIGFKGVRIEIVNATNTKLRYIVRKSFPNIE